MRRVLAGLLLLGLGIFAHGQDKDEPKAPPLDEKGKAILALETLGHAGSVVKAFFTPDGQKIITVGQDKTVQLWDAGSGERLQVLRLPRGPRRDEFVAAGPSALLAPDGKTLALGGVGIRVDDKTEVNHATLLNLDTGRIIALRGPQTGTNVTALGFSGDGDRLAATVLSLTPGDNQVLAKILIWSGLKEVWQTTGGDGLRPWKELDVPGAHQLALSPDGNRLAVGRVGSSGGRGSTLSLWDLAADPASPPQEIKVADRGMFDNLAWGPDGKRLAVILDRSATVWTRTGDLTVTFWTSKGDRSVTVWSNTGDLLKTITARDLPGATEKAPGKLLGQALFAGNEELLVAHSYGPKQETAALVRLDLTGGKFEEVGWFTPPGASSWWTLSPDGHRAVAETSATQGLMVLSLWDLQRPEGKNRQLYPGLRRPRFIWSKTGYQLAWVENSRDFVAVLDLTTADLLPQVKAGQFKQWGERSAGAGYSTQFAPLAVIYKEPADKDKNTHALLAALEKPLLYLYVQGQDWVLWTKEGYYAASPGGEKLVGWHVNNGFDHVADFYPVERFRKRFYRPDVIKLVLQKGSVAEALKEANVKAVAIEQILPPKVTLKEVKKIKEGEKTKFRIAAVAEPGAAAQPLQSLRLLLDGHALADAPLVTIKPGEPARAAWLIDSVPGRHELKVLARCPDVSGLSEAYPLITDLPAKDKPVLYRVCVGINQYDQKPLELGSARQDAEAVFDALAKCCTGKDNLFREAKGKPLLDKDATRQAVLEALKDVRKAGAKPGDLLVVFFAGHGVVQGGDFYLLTREADTSQKLAGQSLSGDDLRFAFSQMPCSVLLLMDACHSAAGVPFLKQKPATDDVARSLTDDQVAVTVLAAAMGHETAGERPGHGLFTDALLKGLAAADGNRVDRLLYVHHLYAHVFDEVRTASHGTQTPFLNMPWTVPPLALRQVPEKLSGGK